MTLLEASLSLAYSACPSGVFRSILVSARLSIFFFFFTNLWTACITCQYLCRDVDPSQVLHIPDGAYESSNYIELSLCLNEHVCENKIPRYLYEGAHSRGDPFNTPEMEMRAPP